MRSILFLTVILAVVGTALVSAVPARAETVQGPRWESTSHPYTLDGDVLTLMPFGDDLIVGGKFTATGNAALNHIGSWDGNRWRPLGDGFDYPVRCLGTYQGALIAGGWFTRSGERPMACVARWNGSQWDPLGAGFSSSPNCFVEWNGMLVAGGSFRCRRDNEDCLFNDGTSDFAFAAWWDGTTWVPMGEPGTGTALSAPPRDLIVYKGNLYAAGAFRSGLVVRWDGSGWVTVGPRVDPDDYRHGRPGSRCVAIWDSLLVVGGDFTVLDSTRVDHVIAFDGETWIPMGQGIPRSVLDMKVHGGRLYAVGMNSDGTMREWNGTSWNSLPINRVVVREVAIYKEQFYFATEFQTDDTQWGIGSGDPDEEPGHVYGYPVKALVTFNNRVFINPSRPGFFDIKTLLSYSYKWATVEEGHGTAPVWDIYQGCPATVFNGKLVTGKTIWDGTTAEALAPPPGLVYLRALSSYGDKLIVAGGLPSQPADIISAFDGATWTPFGEGFRRSESDGGSGKWYWSQIDALAEYRNMLIAGGLFELEAGGENVAAWDGTSWNRVGTSLNDMVTCLIVYGDDLIAGGFFDHAGTTETPHIARWDGASWSPLGSGTDGPVYALAVYNNRLVAAGGFRHAGGRAAGSVAAWDGTGWLPLGAGMDGEVLTLAVNQGTLYAGGEFSRADGNTAYHLAQWNEGPRNATFTTLAAYRTPDDGVLIEVSASYLPFDHQGFIVYRERSGSDPVPVNPTPLTEAQFSLVDPSPPLGAAVYRIAGVSSTGAVTVYATVEAPADPQFRFAVFPASPNPFRSQTRIDFDTTQRGPARVAVFDVRGRVVADLLDERVPPGSHTVTWDGRDASGRPAAAGAYFLRVGTMEGVRVQRIVRLAP